VPILAVSETDWNGLHHRLDQLIRQLTAAQEEVERLRNQALGKRLRRLPRRVLRLIARPWEGLTAAARRSTRRGKAVAEQGDAHEDRD
jgi:hypothetical protein